MSPDGLHGLPARRSRCAAGAVAAYQSAAVVIGPLRRTFTCPRSGANRKTFARSELLCFSRAVFSASQIDDFVMAVTSAEASGLASSPPFLVTGLVEGGCHGKLSAESGRIRWVAQGKCHPQFDVCDWNTGAGLGGSRRLGMSRWGDRTLNFRCLEISLLCRRPSLPRNG